ncbi:MAG: ribosome-binding factor A [Candidatus Buchananbacteria bacterium RBG_13_39_9]|uniref:Ribosome-binding factor A n=1 Tax=Candidatus Buchananbacteria bacterium RBG_13_39_9 TaxID=1797531 RepID=A0A1G1XMM7_9BACT|nr:MAG: ribosome-binding factor A [Candidatus Buchananbacteria bacterium RBG_13_39_9]
MTLRTEKINELIRQKLSQIISEEIELPPNTLVTITKAETSPDLKNSKIYITVLPENFRGSTLKILDKNRHHLYQKLKTFLKTKFTPNLKFVIDEQEVFAAEVDKILDEINKQ